MIKKLATLLAIAALLVPSAALAAEEETVSMNFSNADITMVIKYISEATGRNFVVNEKVQGKVTILSPRKVSKDEAYHVFESILSVYGFTAVPAGKVTKIVPVNDAKVLGGTLEVPAPLSGEVRDQMITQLIPLKYISADNMVNALRPLIPSSSYIASYQQSNTLIVVDLSSNLDRILSIIAKLDVEGREIGISVIQLKHAASKDIAQKINSLVGRDPTRPNPPPNPAEQQNMVLADDRLNAIIVVGNDLFTNKVKFILGQLDVEAPPGRQEITVVYLNNANADDLAKVMNQILTAEAKRTGSATQPPEVVNITADKATNSVIITAAPEQVANIKKVIEKLDIPRRQVFVEGVIFEVTASKAKQFGVEWRATNKFTNGGQQMIGGTNFGNINSVAANPFGATGASGLVVGVVDGTISMGGNTYANIGALVSALQSDTDVNILSTPNLLTTDNEEAKLFVGQNVPFLQSTAQTTGGTPIVNVNRQDIGTMMKLTPQIGKNRYVRMKIYEETSSISPTQLNKAQDIITSKRTAETVVYVKDNQNIILGGLISENVQEVENKVPILGDIPLIGWAFKSRSKSIEKTNLLIFLTPHIINNVNDMASITDRKKELMNRASGEDQKKRNKEMIPEPYTEPEETPSEPPQDAPATPSGASGSPSPTAEPAKTSLNDLGQVWPQTR